MSLGFDEDYESVIGLEVHVHLKTRSKLFCSCAVEYGRPPNRQTCPVCLALPGALPVANGRAVESAIRAGLALHGKIHPRSIFARKNYFYPDLPKGYQISQYEEPIVTGCWIDIESDREAGSGGTRRIGITRVHMEEDAGKSMHDEIGGVSDDSLVDLNRAGVPMVEIVSEPDLRSPAEAGAYLRSLRSILRYIDVSEADMEKGQFRCDANVSLRKRGDSELGTRTETKNLNSFRFVEAALSAEIERQRDILAQGGVVQQATMLFDPETARTRVMRLKEDADDYRYFPDPDLIPIVLDPEWIEEVRASLPELPDRKRARFRAEYGLSDYDARLLTASRSLADFFETALRARGEASEAAKNVANWILRDLLQTLKEQNREIEQAALTPTALAALIRLVDEDRVTAQSARTLLPELVDRGGDPEVLVRERGLEAVSDRGLLESTADAVIAENPQSAERYRAGETKVLNFLMGQVMKRTEGKANPKLIRELLARKLES